MYSAETNKIDCLVCLDYPPNKAKLIVDEIPTCPDCFECLAPNLNTEILEKLIIL